MRPLSTLWIALLLCAFTTISAQTTWTGAIDSDWSNPGNWSAGVPSSANEPAIIPNAVFPNSPIVSSNLTIDFRVENFDTLAFTADVNLQSDTIINHPTAGTIEVGAGTTFEIAQGATVLNNNQLTTQGGVINRGVIRNSGLIQISLTGSFINMGTGFTENNNSFNNENIVINNGDFVNAGTVTNRDSLTNNNNFDNGFGSVFNNGITGTNSGVVINNSAFNIAGTFGNVLGTVENLSTISVQASAVVTNDAIINNGLTFFIGGGTLNNNGSFNNDGTLTNDAGTTFSNTGSLTNGLCDHIIHLTVNAVSTGTVINDGVIYAQGSDIAITSGTGVKLANQLTDFPAPTARCSTGISVALDAATNTAMIVPTDIDSASVAPYCGVETLSLDNAGFDCSHAGDNTITLTVTDSLGNTATCQSIVTVLDTVAPVIISCPSDITLNLLPFECEIPVFYNNAAASDNCAMPPSITQVSPALISGDNFPVGETVVTFEANDGNLTDSCSFTVRVEDFQPAQSTLTCTSNAQLSVDLDCETDLHPSMLLMGLYGCWDRFEIFIKNTGETVVTTDYVGQVIDVMVVDTVTRNSCWGKLSVEDKGGPAINGCMTDTLLCIENSLPTTEGGVALTPTFQDCDSFDATYYDDVEHFDCGNTFTKEISRTWLATDNEGNVSSCVQTIQIAPVDLSAWTPVCPADYSKECMVGVSSSLDPSITGFPSVDINGVTYELDDTGTNICNIKATFRDDTLGTSCGAGLNIVRTWRVLDCCASNNVLWSCTQRVNLTDQTDPQVLISPLFETTVDNNNTCTARPTLPSAIITDCSPTSVLIMTPSGTITGNGGQVPPPGLSSGTNIVTYVVTDACGNSSTAEMTVNVIDERPPVPVCKTFTTVSLTTGGTAVIKADSLNAGSTDECCLDPLNAFSVRRMDDGCMMPMDLTFQPEIKLCCADAIDTVRVVLRVTDCAGNNNECMISLLVDNKLLPTISCPGDQTIDCGDDAQDYDRLGRVVTDPDIPRAVDGFASDNCGALTVSSSDSPQLACGTGMIVRTWTATDLTGGASTCSQTITVENSSPFDGDNDIDWPNDTMIANCNVFPDTSITGVPRYTQGACDGVVTTFRDDTTRTQQNDAVTITRYWTVTDWCQFVLNVPNPPGQWTHVQVIDISDPEPPVLTGCDSKLFCNENDNCQPLLTDLSISVSDNCTDNDDLIITWTVDAFSDGVPDVGAGFSGNGMNDSNSYPNGTHEICYDVRDGFNNRTTCCFLFKIIDCKIPTGSCQPSIQTLMPDGNTEVNITVFNNDGSTDNCTATGDLFYSYSSDINDTVRTFTCVNLGDNSIEFWVTDAIGNQTVCNTNLEIQDPTDACNTGNKASIGGAVKDNNAQGISDVRMTISGQGQATIKTDDDGKFQFTNIPAGHDYSLTPVKNDDLRNGVSTIDIVKISQHLLNVKPLDSPYKIIAADVNRTNSISTLDIIAIRKAILFVEDEFPNNTSWRFVDKNHLFREPGNPFAEAIPEVVNLNNLTIDQLNADFVAVKIGDVNGDATPNDLLGVDNRTFDEILNLTTYNYTFEEGELITVNLNPAAVGGKNESLAGMQATINFDPNALKLADIIEGDFISRTNYGLTLLDEGAVTFSWDNANSQTLERGQTFVSLQFQTLAAGRLSEWLSLSSNYTVAEAYDNDGTQYDVRLKFENAPTEENEFELFQNKPNPFSGATVVGFNLPEDSGATLTVFDLSGKVLHQSEDEFNSGYNEFRIENGMLKTTGVFYYRLDTPTNSATRKMILLGSTK